MYRKIFRIYCTQSSTLLAELAHNNLLLRYFQLFIFPSVVLVSQLCLGLTLLWSAASRNLDWIPDFQCSLTGLTGLFSFSVTSNLREAFHHVFHYVNLSNICNVPFHISFERMFFIASQGSTWLAKIFLRCHENFAYAQQKNNQTQAELVFSSKTDQQKNIKEGGEWRSAGSACRVPK